jgi:Cysteine rich repeat
MFHRTVLAVAILATATTFTARAETAEERQACTADAQTHCADEIPDRERVYECLVKKVAQLSAPCKKIISDSLRPRRK